MDVNTLQFWQTVKSEYKPEESKYICDSSETFKQQWIYTDKDSLRRLAKKYITEIDAKFDCGYYAILIGVGAEERLDFIDWCIKKYEK